MSFWSSFPANLHLHETELPLRDGKTPLVDRFAGVLSVLDCDAATGVFLMSAGGLTAPASIGRVFELTPALWVDAAASQMLERSLRLDFPAGATISATLYASAQVSDTLSDWVDTRNPRNMQLDSESASLLAAMARNRAAYFEALSRYPSAALGCVRRYRSWIAVTVPSTLPRLEDILRDPKTERFLSVTDSLASALDSFGMFAKAWDEVDYVQTVRELLNPGADDVFDLPVDAAQPLRDQVVSRALAIDVERHGIRFERLDRKDCVRNALALGVSAYAATTEINRMAGLMGSAERAASRILSPYIVTATIEPTSLVEDRARTAMKLARVKQLAHTEIGVFLNDLAERERDLAIAEKACENGDGLCRLTHEMVVFSNPEDEESAVESAKAVFTEAGLVAELDAGLQLMGLLLVLPLEASLPLMKDARLARHLSTKTRQSAAHMLPIVGETSSSPPRPGRRRRTPMLVLVTRRGTLFLFDLFANRNGNYNAVVAGTSGSGKSVLSQELLMAVLALGGRVWVFDIGKSYKHCAELVGGQWIDFETDADAEHPHLCLNPLDMPDVLENLDELAEVVVSLANGDAALDMTSLERLKGEITATVRMARAAGTTPTLTELARRLSSSGFGELIDMAVRLTPYTAGGRFSRWFEGPLACDFEKPLVVLEMEALANKPVLQNAVLLILIMHILACIRKAPRSMTKLIVIDEAWRLLTGNAGRFIEWACRTLRKYGAGIVCISQSVEDFTVSSSARAVRMNADTVFLLRQKSAGIASYTEDPALRELLSSLTTEGELFSELYVKTGDRGGVVARLMLDPYSLTAYSTRADVFEAVEKARKEGLTTREAIGSVAFAKKEGR